VASEPCLACGQGPGDLLSREDGSYTRPKTNPGAV
jgi:hypothetical protein